MNFRKAVSLLMAIALCLMAAAVPAVTSAQTIPSDNATDYDISVSDQDGDGVIRVACIGDSITAGSTESNWPKYLQEYLNVLGETDGNTYEVKNHGKGGASCRHYTEDLDNNPDTPETYFYYDDIAYTSSLTYTPDVVIVQMGTNDVGGGAAFRATYFVNDYYTYLVKPYQDKGATVIVSTPPYACNGGHDGEVNGPIHDEQVAMADQLGLKTVDTNRLMYGLDEAYVDGLHGNVTGYSRMALNFYKYIFGGEVIEASFTAKANTRVTLVDQVTGRSFVCVTDEAGNASLPFIKGDHEFKMSAECTGYKKIVETISLDGASKAFSITQEVGGYNVSVNGMPYACDSKVYGSNVPANLNDGVRDNGGYQPDHWTVGDWCALQLDDVYLINTIVLYWESEQYMSKYQDGGYAVYFKENGQWVLQSFTDVLREVYNGTVVADTITLDPAVEIENIKIEFLEGKSSHAFAPKLFEIEMLTDDVDKIPGLTPEPEPTVRPTWDPNADYGENLALSGTGIACDSPVYGGVNVAANLNDTQLTTGGYQPSSFKVGDWCGIQLAAASKVDTVVLYWETESFVSMYQDKGYRVYIMVNGEWEWYPRLEATRYDGTGDIVVDVLTIDPAATAEGVKIEFLQGESSHQYAPKMYEMEVYGTLAPGGAASGDVDMSGDVGSTDLTLLARAVANIETLTDEATLAADVDMSGQVDSADLTALARYVAGIDSLPTPPTPEDPGTTLDPTNFAANKVTGDNGHQGSLTSDRAVDGDEEGESRWAGVETHGADDSHASQDFWWVDFGEEVSFSTVKIKWEVCYGRAYTIEVKDASGDPTDTEGWTVVHSVTGRTSSGWAEHTLDEAATGRYMRINITEKDNTWGVSFYEVIVQE